MEKDFSCCANSVPFKYLCLLHQGESVAKVGPVSQGYCSRHLKYHAETQPVSAFSDKHLSLQRS